MSAPETSRGMQLVQEFFQETGTWGGIYRHSIYDAEERRAWAKVTASRENLAAYLSACESVVEAARHVIEMFPFAGLSFLAPDERDALIALDKELKAVDELGGITQTTGNQK